MKGRYFVVGRVVVTIAMLDLSTGLGVGGKEPALDDDADIDISRLPAVDRDAIMARVTPDDSTPPDAFALAQNEIRREVPRTHWLRLYPVVTMLGCRVDD